MSSSERSEGAGPGRSDVASPRAVIRRIAIVATASGNGKTTLARRLAAHLAVPFVELDALHHGPGWTEATADELRARVAPIVAGERWIVDGVYRGKLGDLVLERAELVVWLDLPARVWLPRLLRRTVRRIATREELWNGNRETVRSAIGGGDALIPYALRQARRRRRGYPTELAPYRTVRLRSTGDVERFVRDIRATRC